MEKISLIYQMGLRKAIRYNAAVLRRMREIMDGEARPPRYCVTEAMRIRWKRKTLMKLLRDSRIVEKMNDALMECGEDAVSEIQQLCLGVYETAHKTIEGDAA